MPGFFTSILDQITGGSAAATASGNTTFACSSTACVGWTNGATNPTIKEQFRQLQLAINAALKILGKSTITADGMIGSGTVKAYAAIRAKAPHLPALPTMTDLAAHAYLATVSIKNSLAFLQGQAPAPAPVSITQDIPQMPGQDQPTAPGLPASAAASVFFSKNKNYILGGLGLAVVGAAFYLTGDKPKTKSKRK